MLKQLLFVLICLFPPFLCSQEGFSLQELSEENGIQVLQISPDDSRFQKGRYHLIDYLYVLIDSTDTLRFLECSSPEYVDSFIPFSSVSRKDLALHQHTYWLRLSVQSTLPEEVSWLTNFVEAEVTAFIPTEKGEVSKNRCGTLIPVADRYFNNRYGMVSALPIHLPADNSQTYYWQIKPQLINGAKWYDLNLNFTLLSDSYLTHFLIFEGILLALILGFFFAVRNISFIFYLYNKSQLRFLWYSVYCLISILAGVIIFGYDLHFLFPEMAFSHYYFWQTLVLIIWVLTYINFSSAFLQTAKIAPHWDRYLWMLFGLSVISLLWGSLVQWDKPVFGFELFRAGQILLIIIAISLGLLAVFCLKNGNPTAKYYLRAHIILLFGITLDTLTYFQYLPAIPPIHWTIIGAWIQLRVFAYGMGLIIPQAQEQRHLALEESEHLKELNTLKTRLYTNITHEFRTPLTVILGMTANIKGHEQEKNLIARNGQKLLLLIYQMLDLSKFDSGNVQVKLHQADIIFYLNYLVESFYSMAREKDILLAFYTEEEEFLMDFDEEKIQHIVYNLLSNAIKFTEERGKVFLHVKKVESNEKTQLQLKFKDTGKGIPADQLPFIFDRFYQVDGSHTRGSEGTGIGLALSKEYVELLGGKIVVSSEVGKGSEFTVFLPVSNNAPLLLPKDLAREYTNVADELEEPFASQEHESEVFQSQFSTQKKPILLIVEDNKDVVIYIRSIVEKDYRVATASNGKLGLEKALEIIPDIIISDVMMPEMDGLTLTEILKKDQRTSHIPIIILTAKAEKEDRLTGLQTGADAYLTKPFNKEEMLIRLDKLAKLREAMRQYYAQVDPLNIRQDASSNPETIFLKKAGEAVEKNLSNADFTVVHFCREVQLSQPQLYRKLMALTGKSPSIFIRSVRLHKSLELLKNSDLNISEVAWEVGFNDPSYFTRAFQKEFGQSPSEWRK